MRSIMAAALALVLASSAFAAMTLDDLKVGTTVSGPSNTLKDLKGKVVFVEYWGTR